MKKAILSILICLISFHVFGQKIDSCKDKTYKNLYLELLGASNMIGISYDTRINSGSVFGYRVGISYFYGTDYNSNKGHGISVPWEFNCLLGKRRSKFEIGAGINIGLYSIEEKYMIDSNGNETIFEPLIEITRKQKTFGYYIFSNIGYRYQRKNGFMFRVGVSPSFNFGDRCGISKSPVLYPYISFGYTIK